MESGQQDTVHKTNDSTTSSLDSILNRDDSTTSAYVSEPNVNCDNNISNRVNKVVSEKQNIPSIYRQDVVRSKQNGMIGIVTEVAGDADSDGSTDDDEDDEDDDDEDDDDEDDDDEDDDEDDDDDDEGAEKGELGEDNLCNGNDDSKTSTGSNKDARLSPDQVRVLWKDESESTPNVSDLVVIDRAFLHGDYVASATDPTGQVGIVVDVNISVDLLSPDGSIIEDVSSKDLKRVRDFAVGDYVVLGPWLGRIDDVLDNVTVFFDDGSMCKVTKAEPLHLKPISKNILDDVNFPYYPGQRVRASSSSVFKNAKWISGSWRHNRLEGTVAKVTVGSVFIYWIASAGYGPDSSTAPAEEQSPKNLKLLSCFAHANWQLGDWCLFPSLSSWNGLDKDLSKVGLHDSVENELDLLQTGIGGDLEEVSVDESGNNEYMDLEPMAATEVNDQNIESNISPESSSCASSLTVSKEPGHESWPLHRKRIRKVVVRRDKKARKKGENFERALLIINTTSKIDVAWQDGNIGRALNSTSSIPINNPGDHEFVAEQYVVEKASDDDENIGEGKRVGVVKSVNAKERTASVRWLRPVVRAEDPREFNEEEIVSVYELEMHPDYEYCYGDVVVRLSPVSVFTETDPGGDSAEESKNQIGSDEVKHDVKKHPGCMKVKDLSDNKAFLEADLSWAGNITGLKNGDIEVTWADGMVSTVGPQAIYVVDRDDDDESIGAGSDINDDAASWETVNDEEMDSFENSNEDIELQDATDAKSEVEDNGEMNSSINPAFSVPLAAMRFVSRLASGIFSLGQKNLTRTDLVSNGDSKLNSEGMIDISEEQSSNEESTSHHQDIADSSRLKNDNRKGEEHVTAENLDVLEAAEALCSMTSKDLVCSFKHFDIAKDPLDHHFHGNEQSNNGRKWFKKVQQDWNILQNNLPDTIYVRVYEDRVDLLRAVIIGAYGTPYQDGLFFFDFHLPPDYPDVPPSAYYHSGGWRINPNLYEEGKVCLSLLNTWTGRGNEVWDPKSSSILQVLVSLQGLVLNSKPYFNEASYDKQVGTTEGEKNSLSYNENTFLLSCKTMMYLMRKPPKDFEELIKDHFRNRGYYILKACDAYMKGQLIGSLNGDASITDSGEVNSTSVGFKLMLAKIVPKLLSALSEVGVDCQEFKHLQQT